MSLDKEEAATLLRQNSTKEKLNKLAQESTPEDLALLIQIAVGLSWDTKNSAYSTFVRQN